MFNALYNLVSKLYEPFCPAIYCYKAYNYFMAIVIKIYNNNDFPQALY